MKNKKKKHEYTIEELLEENEKLTDEVEVLKSLVRDILEMLEKKL